MCMPGGYLATESSRDTSCHGVGSLNNSGISAGAQVTVSKHIMEHAISWVYPFSNDVKVHWFSRVKKD